MKTEKIISFNFEIGLKEIKGGRLRVKDEVK